MPPTSSHSDAVIFCSNRGPFTAGCNSDGEYAFARTRPNGLVPVLYQAISAHNGEWIYAARSESDREIARSAVGYVTFADRDSKIRLRPVDIPADVEKSFYNDFSNDVLAKVLHYLYDLSGTSDLAHDSWPSYERANRIFAERLLDCHDQAPIVFHDWHVILVAGFLRDLLPARSGPLIYFHHVAWSQADYFGALPRNVRSRILSGMLAHDVVSFHTQRWAESFIGCCTRYLGQSVRVEGDVVHHAGRATRIVVAPATVDAEELWSEAGDMAYQTAVTDTEDVANGRLIVLRAERADRWKNPLRGLLAIERLLERHPDLSETVWFPCLLSPTRTWLADYRSYLDECRAVAERINARFGHGAQEPVALFIADDPLAPDRALALALLTLADVVTVTPTFDGLNIVAMEGAVLSKGDQVVVISDGAGLAETLMSTAIQVNAFDVEDIADGVARAIRLDSDERRERSAESRRLLTGRRPSEWLTGLLQAAAAARPVEDVRDGSGV